MASDALFQTNLIIRHVERGEKNSDVAAHFNISMSMLSIILKNKLALRDNAKECPNADGRRLHKPANNHVEKALYQSFSDVRTRHLPISGPMLQAEESFRLHPGRRRVYGGQWLASGI